MGTRLLVTCVPLLLWRIWAQKGGNCTTPSSLDLPAPRPSPVEPPRQTPPTGGLGADSALQTGYRVPSRHNPASAYLPRPCGTVTGGVRDCHVLPGSARLPPGGLRVSGQRGNGPVQGRVTQRPGHVPVFRNVPNLDSNSPLRLQDTSHAGPKGTVPPPGAGDRAGKQRRDGASSPRLVRCGRPRPRQLSPPARCMTRHRHGQSAIAIPRPTPNGPGDPGARGETSCVCHLVTRGWTENARCSLGEQHSHLQVPEAETVSTRGWNIRASQAHVTWNSPPQVTHGDVTLQV